MRAEETIKISLTAAIELIDTSTGERYRNKAIKIQIPMGLRWQRKEDGYLILTGTCTVKEISLHIEGIDIIPVNISFSPDKDRIITIPVYPSPARVRRAGIFYQEGCAAPESEVWAELDDMVSTVRLREAYSSKGCEISLFSRQNMIWKGQTFMISEGRKKELFTIIGESEGKNGDFIMEKPLAKDYGVKATVSPVIKGITTNEGRYLLSYPKEKVVVGSIHEETA